MSHVPHVRGVPRPGQQIKGASRKSLVASDRRRPAGFRSILTPAAAAGRTPPTPSMTDTPAGRYDRDPVGDGRPTMRLASSTTLQERHRSLDGWIHRLGGVERPSTARHEPAASSPRAPTLATVSMTCAQAVATTRRARRTYASVTLPPKRRGCR